MAIARKHYTCPICGEPIKEIHKNESKLPSSMRTIGDTFIGYKEHICPPKAKKIKWKK